MQSNQKKIAAILLAAAAVFTVATPAHASADGLCKFLDCGQVENKSSSIETLQVRSLTQIAYLPPNGSRTSGKYDWDKFYLPAGRCADVSYQSGTGVTRYKSTLKSGRFVAISTGYAYVRIFRCT